MQVAAVQTCRGSHTHTILKSPHDDANLYVYVNGTAGVRSPLELAGCKSLPQGRPWRRRSSTRSCRSGGSR